MDGDVSDDNYDSDFFDLDGFVYFLIKLRQSFSELTSTDSASTVSKEELMENGEKQEDMESVDEPGDDDIFEDREDTTTQPDQNGEEQEWKILGEHKFMEKKILPSAPAWAEKPSTFTAQIVSRTGDGIEQFEGLDQDLFNALDEKISTWFPVQRAVLPQLLDPTDSSHDVAISAPTGSGKTLCYLIPIMNRLFCGWKSKRVCAIVLAPTRTLINQIAKVTFTNILNSFNVIPGIRKIQLYWSQHCCIR